MFGALLSLRSRRLGPLGLAVTVAFNGRSQAVSIKPRGGDVSDVRIELKRNG